MDERTLHLLLNTLVLAAATCAVSVPLGTILAWLLVRTDLLGRGLWRALLGLMLFVPLYLQAAAWQAGFGLQGWCTLGGFAPVLLEGWRGAVWIHGMAAVPWVVLIVGFGLAKVEREIEESALLDASVGQVFWHITLRSSLPAVGVAALWVALTTAGEMTVTDLFAVRTYAEEVYTLLAVGQEPGVTPPGVLPGAAMTVVLVAAGLILCRGLAPGDRPLSVHTRGWTFRLGRLRVPMSLAAAGLLALLIGLPLGNLIYKAGVIVSPLPSDLRSVAGEGQELGAEGPKGEGGREKGAKEFGISPQVPKEGGTGLVREFSLRKCLATIAGAPGRHSRELGWSLLICPLAAAAAVAVAIWLAWLARRGGAKALPALVTAAVSLAVPGPVLGLAIITLLDRPELPPLAWLYDHSILAPLLALWVRGLPVAIFVLWYALRTVPREMLEMAAIDGAGPVAQLCRVALPMRWPAVGVAFLLSLAVALGDLAASILVVPPGVTTLSIRIFGLLHYGVEDQVAGVCLALAGLLAAVAAAAWGIMRRTNAEG